MSKGQRSIQYQIYALYDPRDYQSVMYVGATGKGLQSRLQAHIHTVLNEYKNAPINDWIRSLVQDNVEPCIRLLEAVGKDDWEEAEKRWIAKYQRPELTNLASGGKGSPGVKLSLVRKEKLKATRKGIANTPEHNAKIGKSNYGHRHTEETKQLISQTKTGVKLGPMPEEQRLAISKGSLGKVFSAEHKAKLAEAQKRRNIGNLIWINDGSQNKRIQRGEIPAGWSAGRVGRTW